MTRKQITIYTDGSCLNNGKADSYGGWAAILSYCDKKQQIHRKEYCGGNIGTTNNRMELAAIIGGISKLIVPCDITVVTDSKYAINVLSKVPDFAKNEWHYPCGTGNPLNLEQLKTFWQILSKGKHTIKFQYIKSHDGNPENEHADALAKAEARAMKKVKVLA